MAFVVKDTAGMSKKYSFSIVIIDKLKPAEQSQTINASTSE
jgi:hypothetical protein